MEKEIWKDIPSKPGWQASSLGRVRRVEHETIISQVSKNGKPFSYKRTWPAMILKQVANGNNGYLKTSVGWTHRIVCEAFHGSMPEGCRDVNHKDEDRTNNRPENLEWCTHQQNLVYGTRCEKVSRTAVMKKLKNQLDEMELVYPGITEKAMSFIP